METWQIATTATLARLEQRAEDQRDKLVAIDQTLREHTERIRALEDQRTGSRAVLRFSRGGVALVAAAVGSVSATIARHIH